MGKYLALIGVLAGLGAASTPRPAAPPARIQGGAGLADNFRYTADSVTVQVFKFRFADSALAVGDAEIRKVLDTVAARFTRESGGRFRFKYDLHAETWSYGSNLSGTQWGAWSSWAQGKVAEAGFSPAGATTVVMVCGPSFGYNSGGVNPRIDLFGRPTAWTIYHEMGHALGLLHANGLEAGTQVIGSEDYAAGNKEYGNVYCNMGIGYERAFNLVYKHYFGWLKGADIIKANTGGHYRIHPHDQGVQPGGPVGLTFPSGNGKYTYWVEYRPGDALTREGVLVNVAGFLDNQAGHPRYDRRFWDTVSYLLDMTPNSKPESGGSAWWGDDMRDAALTVGKTFRDPFGGASLKVVTVNAGVWDADGWIDVLITLPSTPVSALPAPRHRFLSLWPVDVLGRAQARKGGLR